MERTVTDKWITRDENGKVVEQKGERSWHGQTSGLHRRSDGTGESWHRVADLDPKGKSSFIDNRRLYTGDYVIEVTENTFIRAHFYADIFVILNREHHALHFSSQISEM
ncbi:unnamed protein product [Anisakis simplex]|uniref:Calpain_III domain-containing protein n=1 Tax=Anisakis simplex TaxID=6269 RepID=A0A0M3K2E8_ANISI|nr:unnamed protein product [Anisakis simplex]